MGPEGQQHPPVGFVDDLGGGGVEGSKPGEDTYISSYDAHRLVPGEVANGQKKEEEHQQSEDHLERPVQSECGYEHVGREDAPGQ